MLKQVFLTLFLSSVVMADTGYKDTIRFTETDKFPSCMAGEVQVSPGTLICSGQVAKITTGGGGGSGTSPFSAFYLKDSSNVVWSVTTQTNGALTTTVVASAVTGALYRTSVVMQDSSLAYWTLTVNTSGNLVTTSGGSFDTAIKDFILNDSTGFSWVMTVNAGGTLITS